MVRPEPIARCRGPVDCHKGLQTVLLHVGIDVHHSIRLLAKLVDQLRDELVDRLRIVSAHRILIFSRRLTAADMQVLLCLQEQSRPGNGVELGTQALDDLGCRGMPLRQRLQLDIDIGCVAGASGRPGSGESEDRGDRRVLLDDVLQLRKLFRHRRE